MNHLIMNKGFLGAYHGYGQKVRLDDVERSLDDLFSMIKRLNIISSNTYIRSVGYWRQSETRRILCQI